MLRESVAIRSSPSTSRAPSGASHGFTLIELLVVIGIIAILIGVLIPTLNSSRRTAANVACMNNLRQLGIGSQAYAATFRGILPWEGYAEGDRPIRHLGWWEDPATWFNAAPQYAKSPRYCDLQAQALAGGRPLPKSGDKSLFVCPLAGPAAVGPQDDAEEDGYFLLWGTDEAGAPDRRRTYWCYGYNTQLDGGVEDRNSDHRIVVNLARLRRPSEVVLLAEKIMQPGEVTPKFMSSVGQQEVSWREFPSRHNGGGYVLLTDGHVAWCRRKDVVYPKPRPDGLADHNLYGSLVWNPAGMSP
jgi:prepilin-type N-terminal cleavage/methylation domain-containing protein/prepilin-type processing-associated H-X9-DG protein